MSITTISNELIQAIKNANLTLETLCPMIGMTPSNFSQRKHGRVDFGLNECYQILDILKIPRNQIEHYFVGGMLPKKDRWGR